MYKIFSKISIGVLFLLGIAFIPHDASAGTLNVMANPMSITIGQTSTITWTSTGMSSCVRTDTGASVPVNSTNGFIIGPFTTAGNRTFTITCQETVTTPPPAPSCPARYATCFTADTLVTMADNTTKNIQDVKIGDVLKGDKTNNTVFGLHQPKLNGKLYSFNGGRYFVTEEHPFKTIDGWKSINPKKTEKENIGITVTELKVGDTLITEDGLIKLNTIDSKEGKANTDLYNFILNGDHTYYADGYLVHNKDQCRGPNNEMLCSAGFCISGNPAQVTNDGECPISCSAGNANLLGSCPSGYTKICTGGTVRCVSAACSTPSSGSCGPRTNVNQPSACRTITTQSNCIGACVWTYNVNPQID